MRKAAVIAGLALASALSIGMSGASTGVPASGEPGSTAWIPESSNAIEHDVRAIAQVRGQWLQALNRGDTEAALKAYAPGAVVLLERAAPRLGAAEIAGWHKRWDVGAPGAEVWYDLDARIVSVDGPLAVEEWTAEVTVSPRGDALAIGGDVFQFRQGGVRVYRKDERGAWHIDRETWLAEPTGVRALPVPGAD